MGRHASADQLGDPPSSGLPASAPRLPGDLEAVYRDHADFVLPVAHQLGVRPAHVEHIVHDLFLVVHRRLSEFDGRSMRAWLYGITRRVVGHHVRGSIRSQRREHEHAVIPSANIDPERGVEIDAAVAIIEGFVAGLDEDQRAVFVLAELEGTPMPEIAAALGINLNTAYSRLRLARRRFEAVLERTRDAQATTGAPREPGAPRRGDRHG